ncbi:hypothetical protein NHJ13734_005185 [Beauveria thailandica]
MAPELPGYYFDNMKKKYFKIEPSHSASPSSAAALWTADAVKRRRAASSAASSAARRTLLLQRHVRRHAGLETDMVARGRLRQELGVTTTMTEEQDDVRAAAWAEGSVDKGSVSLVPSFARARYANMACMYVGGDDTKTGLGVAYATLDEETLVGSYLPTDDNDTISFSDLAPESSGRRRGLRAEMVRCPQMSSIRYHAPSHKILLTSREPDHSCGLYFFSPLLSAESDHRRPQWLLGETSHYQRLYIRHHRLRDSWIVHQSTPAPASSPLLCVVGTNAGILSVSSDETMSWLAPSSSSPGTQQQQQQHAGPQEIFAQDFQQGNHNVLLAGGRQPALWITDLRDNDPRRWRATPHDSTVTHLRSVSAHQVLVAGLRSSMSTYDLRFLGRPTPSGQATSRSCSMPVLRFSGYENEAHVHTGWDVCAELGLVAAAQDDGTVALFSLRSGKRVRPGGGGGGSGGIGDLRTETPIKALMWQRMPRERLPSLWVGEGPLVRKFSLGVGEVGDEG